MNFLNYIKGLRKGKEAHGIELDAMYDPFLDDAIDGYNSVKGNHMDRIVHMQNMVSKKTKSNKRWLLPSVASVAVVLFVISYFTIFDRFNTKDYTDSESLYVYIPEDYVIKIQMTDATINPSTEIDNIEELKPSESFNLYIPSEYLEKIDTGTESTISNPKAKISNLDEIIEVSQPIEIYISEKYL